MGEEVVELRYAYAPVGTRIRIGVAEMDWDALARKNVIYAGTQEPQIRKIWDLYCLERPSVQYLVNGTQQEQTRIIPRLDKFNSTPYQKFEHQRYQEIIWWYYSSNAESKSAIICNGITVTDQHKRLFKQEQHPFFSLRMPSIAIKDSDGNLPLNLQRTDLSVYRADYEEELAKEVALDVIAYALAAGPTRFEVSQPLLYPGICMLATETASDYLFEDGNYFAYAFGPDGFTLFDPHIIASLNCRSLLLPLYNKANLSLSGPGIAAAWLQPNSLLVPLFFRQDKSGGKKWLELIADDTINEPLQIFQPSGIRYLISSNRDSEDMERLTSWAETRSKSLGKWTLFESGSYPTETFAFKAYAEQNSSTKYASIAEWYLRDDYSSHIPSPQTYLSEKWRQYIGNQLIPYDARKRQALIINAYKDLGEKIEQHREFGRSRKKVLVNEAI